jgi:RNA polymerase-binding transcription factor DksA
LYQHVCVHQNAGEAGVTDSRSELTHGDIRSLNERLEERKAELFGQMEELRREVAAPGDDEETTDDGSLLERREEALGQMTFVRDELERVEHALSRMKDGTYGLSEISGKPIPVERLKALPTATTLVGEEPGR